MSTEGVRKAFHKELCPEKKKITLKGKEKNLLLVTGLYLILNHLEQRLSFQHLWRYSSVYAYVSVCVWGVQTDCGVQAQRQKCTRQSWTRPRPAAQSTPQHHLV